MTNKCRVVFAGDAKLHQRWFCQEKGQSIHFCSYCRTWAKESSQRKLKFELTLWCVWKITAPRQPKTLLDTTRGHSADARLEPAVFSWSKLRITFKGRKSFLSEKIHLVNTKQSVSKTARASRQSICLHLFLVWKLSMKCRIWVEI